MLVIKVVDMDTANADGGDFEGQDKQIAKGEGGEPPRPN